MLIISLALNHLMLILSLAPNHLMFLQDPLIFAHVGVRKILLAVAVLAKGMCQSPPTLCRTAEEPRN